MDVDLLNNVVYRIYFSLNPANFFVIYLYKSYQKINLDLKKNCYTNIIKIKKI
jgi:hypothetical protein